MNNKTNLPELQQLAIAFLYLEPQVNAHLPVFIDHPYFNNRILVSEEHEFVDIINQPDEFEKIRERFKQKILDGNLCTIFGLMLTKYHLTFLKHAKSYMSKIDFEKHLACAWVSSENPNQDINVPIRTLISWFSKANKTNLMHSDELKYYNNLPDKVEIYRGIAVGRAEQEGLSWTCNYDTAKWFAGRFDTDEQKGYILKGVIKKEDIFAYLNSRDEDEILCNSKKIINIERIKR